MANAQIQLAELSLHLGHALVADGAFVRRLHMLGEAFAVDAVSAGHEADRLWRREHVVAANRTVAVGRPLNTLVVLFHGDGNAGTAFLVVHKSA